MAVQDELQPNATPKKPYTLLVLALALVAVLAVVGGVLLTKVSTLPEPARPVERMLELRRDRSRDTSAYAEIVKSPNVAKALTSDITTANANTSPIPEWETPYVSAQESSTADVVVVWRKDAKFKQWAKATIFGLERLKGKWLISDAREVTGTVPPKLTSPK